MSKKSSSILHELIHSMSKSEKRYFKVLSSRHTIGSENNYIMLFDFIEKQEVYNEPAIFDHFKGEAFLNKFSITKARLYDLIIKALDGYYSNSSVDAQIYKLLHSAEILYKKSLYNHAERQLLCAEKLALKNNRYNLLLEINRQHKLIMETSGYTNTEEKDIEAVHEKDCNYSKQIAYYNFLWDIKSKLFLRINKKGKARSKEDVNEFNFIINGVKSQKSIGQLPFESEYLYNHLMSAYHYAVLQPEKCLTALNNNLQLLSNHPKKVQESPNKYFSVLTNIIHLESDLGHYTDALKHLNELKYFPKKYNIQSNEDLSIKLFSSTSSTELMLHTKQGCFNKAVSMASNIEKGFQAYGERITPLRKAYLSFKLAVAFFGVDDYNTSLKWINNILNDNDLDEKEDIMAFAQILNLILHLELKNKRLLPYAFSSTLRFLKKRNRTYQFETLFIKHINKVTKTNDPFEAETLYISIETELQEILNDPFESVALEYFDFISWLKSKIKHKPFQEVKRKTYLASIV